MRGGGLDGRDGGWEGCELLGVILGGDERRRMFGRRMRRRIGDVWGNLGFLGLDLDLRGT